MSFWAGLDPGRCKCGLVLVDLDHCTVREGCIVPPEAVRAVLENWHNTAGLDGIVLGDGTTSRRWLQDLSNLAPMHEVDERDSTLQARQRYWDRGPHSAGDDSFPSVFRSLQANWMIWQRWSSSKGTCSKPSAGSANDADQNRARTVNT